MSSWWVISISWKTKVEYDHDLLMLDIHKYECWDLVGIPDLQKSWLQYKDLLDHTAEDKLLRKTAMVIN